MSLVAKETGSNMEFETTPEGTFEAVCYRVIDMGSQENYFDTSKSDHKVMLSFEIQDEDAGRMTDGRPFSVHKQYTVSLHERATLRKHLEAWRGKKFTADELKGFDLSNLLGKPVVVQVMHKDSKDGTKTFAEVNNYMPSKRKDVVTENELVNFDIDADNAQEVLATLSQNVQEKIVNTPEGQAKGLKVVEPKTEEEPKEDKIAPVPDGDVDLSSLPF